MHAQQQTQQQAEAPVMALREDASTTPQHPRLAELVSSARRLAAGKAPVVALVYPCDALALEAAREMARAGIAWPLLVGPRPAIEQAAAQASIDIGDWPLEDVADPPADAARRACDLVRAGRAQVLMKGSLHTDALMSALVDRGHGLRGRRRISHLFLFDLPRYPQLLGVADCVVNIAPDLTTKADILSNALEVLHTLGVSQPRVGIVAAVETVNPAIPATVDAHALVERSRAGEWPGAIIDGPFGFDNAISAAAAHTKHIDSPVCGHADLLLVPDLNAGNMLYKSFVYIGGGECAGIVLGAQVPVVLTSRADSLVSRIASVALAVLATASPSTTVG